MSKAAGAGGEAGAAVGGDERTGKRTLQDIAQLTYADARGEVDTRACSHARHASVASRLAFAGAQVPGLHLGWCNAEKLKCCWQLRDLLRRLNNILLDMEKKKADNGGRLGKEDRDGLESELTNVEADVADTLQLYEEHFFKDDKVDDGRVAKNQRGGSGGTEADQ
jgi:hypothetical protein